MLYGSSKIAPNRVIHIDDRGNPAASPLANIALHLCRHLNDDDSAIGFALQQGSVESQELTPPPIPSGAFFRHAGEPILPQHGSDLLRRLLREGIAGKKSQHIFVFVAREQPYLGVGDDRILAPRTQRGEPQVPVETRLIRSVDSGRRLYLLRLIAKGIWRPVLTILRTLKFNLVASARHYREQAVLIGDAEGFKIPNRLCRERDCHGE